MPEITVRRVGAQVIMTLIDDDKRKVEVSLDEAEAATLGSLLLGMPNGQKAAGNAPRSEIEKPSDGGIWPGSEDLPPFQDSRGRRG